MREEFIYRILKMPTFGFNDELIKDKLKTLFVFLQMLIFDFIDDKIKDRKTRMGKIKPRLMMQQS